MPPELAQPPGAGEVQLPSPAPASVRREAADHPGRISARGWGELVWAGLKAAARHRAPSQAAAAAFYAFLAFAPAVAAFGSAYGLVADPRLLQHRLDAFTDVAPAGVLRLVQREVLRFTHGPPLRLLTAALSFGLFSLASATSAMRQIMIGLATAYRVTDTRPWWLRRLWSLLFAALTAGLTVAAAALVLKSADMEDRGFWPVVRLGLRWTALFAASVLALALLYRYGTGRPRARWRWVTPGSVLAAFIGLATSAGMTVYLARFSSYESNYGGLGSVLGLIVWLWAGMLVVIGGGELNRAIEDKTSADTGITGRGRPAPEPGPPAGPPPPARR